MSLNNDLNTPLTTTAADESAGACPPRNEEVAAFLKNAQESGCACCESCGLSKQRQTKFMFIASLFILLGALGYSQYTDIRSGLKSNVKNCSFVTNEVKARYSDGTVTYVHTARNMSNWYVLLGLLLSFVCIIVLLVCTVVFDSALKLFEIDLTATPLAFSHPPLPPHSTSFTSGFVNENKGLTVDLWSLNDLPGMTDLIPTTGDGPAGPSVVDSSGNQSNSTTLLAFLGALYAVFIILVEVLYLTTAMQAIACLDLLPYGIYVRPIRFRL